LRKYRNPLAFVEQAPRQTRHSDCHGLAAQFNDRLAAPTIHALLAVSLVRQKAARRLRHSPDHHSSPRHHGADCRAERIRARGRDDTIAAAPNDWLPAYLIATAHLWNDDLEGAEEVLTSRSLTANTVPAVQMLRWEIFEQLGRTYYGQLLGHYPYSFRAHVVRARILDAQDKPEALDEYKAAIAANPTQAGARLDLAYYYLANANIPQALSECQQVLGLNPYSGDAKACVGRIYVEMRQPDQALPLLEAAVKTFGSDSVIHSATGTRLRVEKRVGQSHRRIQKGPRARSEPEQASLSPGGPVSPGRQGRACGQRRRIVPAGRHGPARRAR